MTAGRGDADPEGSTALHTVQVSGVHSVCIITCDVQKAMFLGLLLHISM